MDVSRGWKNSFKDALHMQKTERPECASHRLFHAWLPLSFSPLLLFAFFYYHFSFLLHLRLTSSSRRRLPMNRALFWILNFPVCPNSQPSNRNLEYPWSCLWNCVCLYSSSFHITSVKLCTSTKCVRHVRFFFLFW